MRAPRDPGRKAAAPVDRMWQVYADEIGIPDGVPADSNSIPEQSSLSSDTAGRPRIVRRRTGRMVAAVAVGAVSVVAIVSVWRGFPTPPERKVEPRSPVVVAATPPAEVTPVALEPARIETPVVEARRDDRQLPARITFEFDSAQIGDEWKPSLQRVVATLNANPDWRVTVEGHTDGHGPADHNRWLSERRAQAVKAYLASAGIAPDRLDAVGFGALRPVGVRGLDGGDSLNRRVEIRLR